MRPKSPQMKMEIMKRLDWVSIDRRINKDTSTWKRVQQIFGVPRSQETREAIRAALMGHRVSDTTRQRISASLRKYYQDRKRDLAEGTTACANAVDKVRLPKTTWPQSVEAWKLLLRCQPSDPSDPSESK